MPTPQPLPSRLIGALFVERGLVSESQIRVALEIQEETGQQLGQILVERFGVSRRELASVIAEQWAKLGGSAGPEDNASWRRLGDIFVERGFVSEDELDNALKRQRQTGERLGEALVAQGVISKFELAGALAEQMAALEETAQDGAGTQETPAEATVHHLPARDPEPDVVFGAVAEREAETFEAAVDELRPAAMAGPDEPEPPVEGVAQELAPETIPVEPELVPDVGYVEPELVPDVGYVEPEFVPDVGYVEPEFVPDVGYVEPEPVPDVGYVEPELVPDAGHVEAELVPDAGHVEAELVPDVGHIEAELVPDVGHMEPDLVHAASDLADETPRDEGAPAPEAPIAAPVEREPRTFTFDYLPEPEAGEPEPPAPEPATVCLAFAPTTSGYRLVPLDTVPAAGDTIHVPDVGERVVLRVGASPLPLDDTPCVFLEEPVAASTPA